MTHVYSTFAHLFTHKVKKYCTFLYWQVKFSYLGSHNELFFIFGTSSMAPHSRRFPLRMGCSEEGPSVKIYFKYFVCIKNYLFERNFLAKDPLYSFNNRIQSLNF